MFLWIDKSRVLDDPKIFFEWWWGEVSSSVAVEDDEEEFESRWCELVFKAGKDSVDAQDGEDS